MNLFFLTGYDDPYLRLSYERLLQKGHRCAGFAHYKQCEAEFPFNKCPSLDGNLLHNPETVADAFKNTVPAILSHGEIEHFIDTKDIFIRTVDRCTLHPRPVRFHLTLFREVLRFSLGFLRKAQPHAIICGSTPHFGWEIIFSAVAKKLSIPSLYIKRTLIQNRISIHLDANVNTTISDAQLAPDTTHNEHINVSNESIWEKHSTQFNKSAKQDITLANTFSFIRHHMRVIKKAKNSSFSPLFSNTIRFKAVTLYYEYLKHFFQVKKLRSHYEMLSQPTEDLENFVFFPLHFQPERSTQPEGGWYEDQFLAAAQIADALPTGFKLYIKEHPRQLIQSRLDIRQKHYRATYDYDALSKLPNTKLIDWRADNSKLIKKSKICITITGSSGWEALQMGIPAITFGEPWYKNCFGCFIVDGSLPISTLLQNALSLSCSEIELAAINFRDYINKTYTMATNALMFLPSPNHHTTFADNLSEAFQKQLMRLKQR